MYEKQGRSEEVQATAQLEDVQTRPPDLGNVFREYHQTVFRAACRERIRSNAALTAARRK